MLSGIVQHTDSFTTCGQITLDDLFTVQQHGYATVINNRPDFEGGADQPTSESIAAQASAMGMDYFYFPVISGQYTDEQIIEFKSLLSRCKPPVFAFCRSGARSTQLWQLALSLST